MKLGIIVAMIIGLLVVGSILVGNLVTAEDSLDDAQNQETDTCSTGCGNSCNAESNCGLASCGAVSGESSCGCS